MDMRRSLNASDMIFPSEPSSIMTSPSLSPTGNITFLGDVEESSQPVSVLFLWPIGMVLLLCCLCCMVQPALCNRRRAAALLAEEERLRLERQQQEALRALSVAQRKKLVEISLVTKTIISCDKDLNLTLGDPDPSTALECGDEKVTVEREDEKAAPASSTTDGGETPTKPPPPPASTPTQSGDRQLRRGSSVLGDDSTRAAAADGENPSTISTCMICLEPFRVGERVSWSNRGHLVKCRHVFHKDCIGEWLIRHSECPSCRCDILQPLALPGDNTNAENNNDNNNDNSLAVALRDNQENDVEVVNDDDANAQSSSIAFVIMNGLISPLRRASSSMKQATTAPAPVTAPVTTPQQQGEEEAEEEEDTEKGLST